MSENPEDRPGPEQLHRITREAGNRGIRLDEILDKVKIDHGDVDAIMDIMNFLTDLRDQGLVYMDTIQTKCERGTMCEIRWFATEK